MLEFLVGKIVESSRQIVSTTSGSVTTSSVAGAGGVVYGGGSSGTVSTRHDNRTAWKIFTTDEKVVPFEHYTEVTGEIGDIVAVFQDDKNILGIYNFTEDFCMLNSIRGGEAFRRVFVAFLKGFFVTLFALIALDEMGAGDAALVLLALPVVWPIIELRRVGSRNARIEEVKLKANEIFDSMKVEIDGSIERKKERLRSI